jgi:hemolysin D
MAQPRWLNPLIQLARSRLAPTTERIGKQLDTPALDFPQPHRWAKWSLVLILFGLGVAGIWSVTARIDVVITARGKLEPLSSPQPIQSKTGGVIKAVLVQEGQEVQPGQTLIQLDRSELLNQLESQFRQRQPLLQQVTILRGARQGKTVVLQPGLSVPPELLNRVQDRALLVAQITGNAQGLSPNQLQRYNLFLQELSDQRSLSSLQANGLQTQSVGAKAQLDEVATRLKIEQEVLSNFQSLAQQGAIPRVDYLRRVTDLNGLQNELNQNQVRLSQLNVSQAQTQIEGRKVISDRVRTVQTELAQLDTQIDNVVQDSQRQLTQLDAQLKQTQLDLQSKDLKSTVSGFAFNVGPKLPGGVAQPGQALLQIVPKESVVARIQVANTDIARLKVGSPVEVRLDAFPFTEFSAVNGTITRVSSDAIVPDGNPNAQPVFQVEVQLEKPFLQKQDQRFLLIPGMSLTANIKTDSRPPIAYVADSILKAFDGVRSVK